MLSFTILILSLSYEELQRHQSIEQTRRGAHIPLILGG